MSIEQFKVSQEMCNTAERNLKDLQRKHKKQVNEIDLLTCTCTFLCTNIVLSNIEHLGLECVLVISIV